MTKKGSVANVMVNSTSEIAADAELRERFRAFVIGHAEPWHREHLGRLYDRWEQWNAEFFEGRLIAPYIMLASPGCTRFLGDYSRVSAFGGHSQVRIRPSLLAGTHKSVEPDEKFAAGRFRVFEDVFLHELVHLYQEEVANAPEKSYKGHGPAFRDKCNEIGTKLGLPPVREAKRRGARKGLPSCEGWPHCVRPADFYLGAYRGASASHAASEEYAEDVEPDLRSQGAKMNASLDVLTVAAQEYARRWPVGSEAEAASSFKQGLFKGGHVERTLAALCNAARDFNEAIEATTKPLCTFSAEVALRTESPTPG